MDTSNWRGPQTGSGAVGDSSMESGDWRAQLQADSRQRIVNKIMDTLKRHLPFSGQEGLQELKKIAVRFEEKIYTAATSQSDYLRKISLKMLTMETRSQNPMPDSMQSNSGANSVNPSDPGSQVMQQVNNQGQPLPIPIPSNHQQQNQQLLQQTMHSNISSTGIQGSSSLSSAMPPGTGLQQSTISNVSTQNQNLQNIQNMSGVQQVGPNNFSNQRQIPGRQQQQQQQIAPQQQQQQQQNQNSHYVYQQQIQQIAKQKLQVQQGNIAPSMQQIQQQQQQNLLQPAVMQPTMMQSVQNQPQSSQPLMNHQNSVIRQQQQQQQQRQQQVQVQPTQQQVQVQPTQSNPMVQQPNATNMQMGQQQNNTYSDMQQQQRMLGQQNKPQQHLIGQHNNLSVSGMQHMGGQTSQTGGQQQLIGSQSGNSGMQQHMMQSKIPVQQQNQQNSGTLLTNQVQSQSQLQQQVMPHMQTQSAQVGMQPQGNMMQGNMQQRIPTSGGFQQQNVIDQQKQMFQQQRPMQEASSTSLDSTAQTGNPNGGDWQEEVYQKIKAMKDLYLLDLNDMHQKILGKLQQHDSVSQQPKNEQLEKLKVFKNMLERFMAFLQIPKHNILANYKEKLSTYEKQIVHVITSNRRKPAAPQPQQQQQQPPQQQLPPPHMQQQSQQTHTQLTHENPMTSQMQTVNLSGGSNSQQTMMNSMQPTSNLDSVNGAQQVNINPMVSHALQPNPNMLHIKQQEQLLQSQQLKQFQNRQMQQQFLHKQQLMQQQQQQFRQQGNQVNQIGQLHDNNNDMKLRQQQQQQMGGVKPGSFQQRVGYHQQMKPGGSGGPFSPQLIPGGGSPQISQHASPQIEGQNMFNKPMQSANSPFTVPSPSTPSASPLPGELMSGVSGMTNVGNIGHGHGQVLTSQSLAIGTPGISASPLLAEFTSPDGNGVVASIVSGKGTATEQPLERLLKVVKSISANALSSSVSDIGSVVSMIDRIAGSAPGNGSRAAVGEDLVAMTKCRLQARSIVTQDGTGTGTTNSNSNPIRKIKRFTSAMPLNVVSSAGSVNDSFKQLTSLETSELDSTASSAVKRPRFETNHALMEEIKEINRGLIDTVVDISEEDIDPAAASSASEGADGTVIKCSFSAVALGPNLKSQYASAQMSPIQPLRLLVPANYPNCSPILLDKFPVEISKEYEDLSVKAKSRFSISLRSLSQPMSLKEIARTWDICARAVISEYAQQSGGGTFSSKYGTWENCLTAA